ncbi:nucleotidyltransferase domain-containing protein [Microbacterium sp. CFH 90308]|uniref:Nucleotidyltransferase domain-containing protein n=2 Tax=Microbacterium salsuginis TaxID=2722803 RepID=A0ABX1KBZ2_9MICO|nr:nucleotidyltransferase domain-containing protein [Microbacterium sp. CFH 90308]NLP84557.1 nucleotidyltransferase domain-containing protein [Microbacterium sp. CFH 90308]
MAEELVAVRGVRAVALGGSRARGAHRPDSDVDLGVYYDRELLDVDALAVLAHRWVGRRVEIAPPGGWGPWVDGGGWLSVEGTDVDWILRDIGRVREQCHRARAGEFGFFAQPGHPLGFLDVAYAGEVAVAIPLQDPEGLLSELRTLMTPYPAALRAAMFRNLWQVDFLLDGAAKGAKRGDVAYVALCATTAVMFIAHAWHAAAGEWVVNEKGLVPGVARLHVDSRGFSESAADVLADLGRDPADLTRAIDDLRALPRPEPM